ncbi:MAG: DUF4923 family protein [Muribaculaceae bacterium]|nr:DUF4923 family protein [Muribaculaceae bacterium]MDE6532275.1 DUF4923 family protein [Muribaculaceae bacterium]
MRLRTIIIALAILCISNVNAQGLGDLLKGLGGGSSDIGTTIGNLVEGVFTKTDLTLADLTGEYESQGPAVAFKSDDLLKKAGGIAGAAALETKLKPYYEQYGLTGMKLSVDSAANFTMTVKGVRLSGDITKNGDDGTFTFNIKAAGMKIGQFTAYVQKSGSNLDLMFDATKLKQLISTVSGLAGGTMTKALSSILDSYDGACIGFEMKGTVAESAGSSSGSAIESLRNILNGR